ncbi:MAG: response regulator [Pseudomonas sp.]
MIIDDTPDIVRLVATLLKAFYQPRVAIDGGRAPQAAASPQPDLILLDVEMPGMEGIRGMRPAEIGSAGSGNPRCVPGRTLPR